MTKNAAMISSVLLAGAVSVGAFAGDSGPNVVDLGGLPGGRRVATEIVNRDMEIPIGQMMVDAQRSALVAHQQLAQDILAVEEYNRLIADTNRRVRQVLTDSTGVDQGSERAASEMTAYHNPPNATFRFDLGTETIVATAIRRFWKAGRGWVMARELKPGDAMRTTEGLAAVKSSRKIGSQPVFNLMVAEAESLFVEAIGVLAHDNSLVSPTPSPFDAVPDLEKAAAP